MPAKGREETPAGALLARLRSRLAREGLHIVLPLAARSFDLVSAGVNGPPLETLLPGARAAFVVGDGGPAFFASFRRAEAAREGGDPPPRDPLDHHTRRRVARAVDEALVGPAFGHPHRVLHPFDGVDGATMLRPLPFQRLGEAAGLPAPGPLGVQVHPVFGPWWAYRALIIVGGEAAPVEAEASLASPCDGCPAPCAPACPGQAVMPTVALRFERCAGHRLASSDCATSCAARLACPVGTSHRYSAEQLAFHMSAALVQIRAYAYAGARAGA